MASTLVFKFSLLLSLLLVSFMGVCGKIPSICKRLECPNYDVIETGKGYEIRHYSSIVLISRLPVRSESLVGATQHGFLRLFNYIRGDNEYKQKIMMTEPVITQVSLRNGRSSFVVSFYLLQKNQASPPPAEGLTVQRLQHVYAAVRQFNGFVTDSNIAPQIAALNASHAGTKWASSISIGYNVAQFNIPFQLVDRVNKVWFLIIPEEK